MRKNVVGRKQTERSVYAESNESEEDLRLFYEWETNESFFLFGKRGKASPRIFVPSYLLF